MFYTPQARKEEEKSERKTKIQIVEERKEKTIPIFKSTEAPGVSIKNIIEEKDKKEEERTAKLANETTPFTEEDLRACWRDYQAKIPEKKILVSTMQNCLMTLNKDYSIDVVVENDIQKKDLEDEKTDLISFLSGTLKNGSIQINVRLSQAGENKSSLSTEERFKEMMKRNQNIRKMQQAWGLEID